MRSSIPSQSAGEAKTCNDLKINVVCERQQKKALSLEEKGKARERERKRKRKRKREREPR